MRGPGFCYAKDIDGSVKVPVIIYKRAAPSITFTLGDAVRINTDGQVDIATTDEFIVGFIASVVDKNGKSLSPDSGTLHDYTMASDNITNTTKQYKIGFHPALANYLWYNDANATVALTETMEFTFFKLANEHQVDSNTSSDTTESELRLIERDPDHDGDTSKALWQVVESQFGTTSKGVYSTP